MKYLNQTVFINLSKGDYLWCQALTEFGKMLSKITNLPQLITRYLLHPPQELRIYFLTSDLVTWNHSFPRIGYCHSELEHFVWTSDLVTWNHSFPRIGYCHSEFEHFVWTSDLATSNHSTPPPQPESDILVENSDILCGLQICKYPLPPPHHQQPKLDLVRTFYVDFRFGHIKSTPPSKSDLLMEILDIKSPPPTRIEPSHGELCGEITVSFMSATHYTRCPFTKKLFAKRVFLDCVLCWQCLLS